MTEPCSLEYSFIKLEHKYLSSFVEKCEDFLRSGKDPSFYVETGWEQKRLDR